MRLEQKSFAEKYIEKIVLLVAVLIAVGIVVVFVLDDYSVEMAGGNAMTPQEIEEDIRSKADSLDHKVKSTDVASEIDGFEVPDYVSRFWTRHNQKLIDQHSISVPLVTRGPRIDGDIGVQPGIRIKPVFPPPAYDLAVRSSNHVVESSDFIRTQMYNTFRDQFPNESDTVIKNHVTMLVKQMDELVGMESPRDVIQVLFRAKVDMEKYREAILAVEEDLRMPRNWWEIYSNFLADVVVERQTLNPDTGEWGDLVEIKPIPGSVMDDHRLRVAELAKLPAENKEQPELKAELTKQLIEMMRTRGVDIARPQPVPYKLYTRLDMSTEVVEDLNLTPEQQAELYEVRQQINDIEAKLRRLTGSTTLSPGGNVRPDGRDIYEEGINPGRPTGRPGQPNTGRPNTGRPNTGGDNKGRPDPGAARDKRKQDQINAYQEKRNALYERKFELENIGTADPKDPKNVNNGREFDSRPRDRGGRNPEDLRGQRGGPIRGGFNEFGQPDENGKLPVVDVFSHDLTVEHGKTYRYRMIYKVINPLYQKDVTPEEVKTDNFGKLLVGSVPSEWSEPVTIEPKMHLFVNKASAQSNSASFELYSIHDGRRMKHVFDASPGDPVGGVAQAEVQVPSGDGTTTVAQTIDITLHAPVVLVDVKEPPKAPGAIGSRGPITVILADTSTGKIFVRNLQDDIKDLRRKDLDNKAAEAAEAAKSATNGRTPLGLNR